MRRKKYIAWIICLILLLACLSCCYLFLNGRNEDKTADDPGQEAVEPSETPSGTELPEIDIPDGTDQPVSQTETQEYNTESAVSGPSGSDTSADTSGNSSSQSADSSDQEPEQGQEESGVFIDENGDILLPEVP